MFKRWKIARFSLPTLLSLVFFGFTKRSKSDTETARGWGGSSRDSPPLACVNFPQVGWIYSLRPAASLPPSQGDQEQTKAPAGPSTQCHCWKAQANSSPGCPALPAAAGSGGPGQELQWAEDQRELPGTGQAVPLQGAALGAFQHMPMLVHSLVSLLWVPCGREIAGFRVPGLTFLQLGFATS